MKVICTRDFERPYRFTLGRSYTVNYITIEDDEGPRYFIRDDLGGMNFLKSNEVEVVPDEYDGNQVEITDWRIKL